MKANEAPEKIYVVDATFPDYVDFDGSPINTKRIDDHDIEYIRKDAFIEKAVKFMEKINDVDEYSWYNEEEHASGITEKCIEDFTKFMRGE